MSSISSPRCNKLHGTHESLASCISSRNNAKSLVSANTENTVSNSDWKRALSSDGSSVSTCVLISMSNKLRMSLSSGAPSYNKGTFCSCGPSLALSELTNEWRSVWKTISWRRTEERQARREAKGATSTSENLA